MRKWSLSDRREGKLVNTPLSGGCLIVDSRHLTVKEKKGKNINDWYGPSNQARDLMVDAGVVVVETGLVWLCA